MERSSSEGAFFSQQALRSVPWLVSSRVATFFLYFFISIVLVRTLSTEEYGIFSLLRSIAEYAIVFGGLGLNFSLLRFTPELIVERNMRSLKMYLIQAVLWQLLALGIITGLLFLFRDNLQTLFHLSFEPYLPCLVFFMAMLLAKDYLNNVLTALYRSKTLAMLSLLQAVVLLGILYWYSENYSLDSIITLFAFGFSIAITSVISVISIVQFFYGFKLPENGGALEKRRLFKLACPTLFSQALGKFMQQYSEIFFLGYFTVPAVVGFYSLGLYLPTVVMTFIPLTLHSLFTSAFSEAYSKDEHCLPQLVDGMYQILILVSLPIACFGVFFGSKVIIWIYGIKMAAAGPVASFFFFFTFLNLIWIPWSIALVSKEKVAQSLWLDVVAVLVNLPLDYFLIKEYEMNGAMVAVFSVFVVTLPLKLWYLRKLLGHLSFPLPFFLRMTALSVGLVVIFSVLFAFVKTWGIIPLSLFYYFSFILCIKLFKVMKEEDVYRFKEVGIPYLTRFLGYLTR